MKTALNTSGLIVIAWLLAAKAFYFTPSSPHEEGIPIMTLYVVADSLLSFVAIAFALIAGIVRTVYKKDSLTAKWLKSTLATPVILICLLHICASIGCVVDNAWAFLATAINLLIINIQIREALHHKPLAKCPTVPN